MSLKTPHDRPALPHWPHDWTLSATAASLFSLLLLIGLLFSPVLARAATPVNVDALVKVTLTKVSVGTIDGYAVTIKNVSQQPINGPMTLVVTSISNPNVKLLYASGYTATGQPYVKVPLLNNVLKPGKITATALSFKKPTKGTPYTFTTSVSGVVANANHPPIASAGPDQTVTTTATVILSGSGSTDPDGNPLTYQWSFVSKPTGSAASLSDPKAVTPSFVADKSGTYTNQLVVNDGTVNSAPDTVSISTVNSAPVANAGPDQSGLVNSVLVLDGSASSDVDGDALTYHWGIIARPDDSTAALSDPGAVQPTVPLDKAGTYVVQLVVNDGTLDGAPDYVTLSTTNSAPVANAGPDQSGQVNDLITLDGSASYDVDGNALTYHWSVTTRPAGSTAAPSDPGAVKPTFTIDKAGTYVIQIVVNDGTLDSVPDTAQISTVNSTPVAKAGPDQTVQVNDLVTLDGTESSDVDGNPLTYRWSLLSVPAGSTAVLSDATAVQPTFTVDQPGTYVAQLIVHDGTVYSAPATVTITTRNSPPVANAGPNQTVFVGSTVRLDGSGSTDVDGDLLSYHWSLTAPAGSAAALSNPDLFNPTFLVDKPGNYVGQLIVRDDTVDSAPATVTVTTQNSPPVANAGPDQSVYVSTTVTLDGSLTHDVDGDTLTYQWALVGVPANSLASLQNDTTVNPSFTVDQPGQYMIQLIANDGQVNSVPDTVTISTVNSRPVAKAGADQTGSVGQTVTLDGSQSSDADHDPLTYRWSLLSRPTNSTASLNGAETAQPTLIPDLVGDYIAQLIVNDGVLDSDPATTTISVLNRPPVIGNTTTALNATEGVPFSLQILASDPDGQPLTFGLNLAPASMTITAAGLVEWPAPTVGTSSFTVKVSDSLSASASRTFTVDTAAALIPVPNLIGQTQAQATSRLNLLHLTVGMVTFAYHPTAPAGTVIGQVPISATLVGSGSPVDLVISQGPAPVTVPDLVGQGKNAALAALQAAQLKAGTITESTSDTVPAGKVISQNPSAGVQLPAGSAVDLVVSIGPAGGGGLPPDPADVAPPVDPTIATNVYDGSQFLYKGSNPIQKLSDGRPLAEGTIEPKRAAVIRGKVLDRSNAPLPGATISVHHHPEFGQTLSRADGQFDMVVNGGGLLTIDYTLTGFLRGQRQINVPWQDFVAASDIALIPRDSQVTTVAANAAVMQVARQNVVSDSVGSRQATVLFPSGTGASIVLSDGTLQPVSTLNIRATEYTIGPDGPKAMPAELPPTSGYTYAVELSADESVAKVAGRDLVFTQPVPIYLENFLNFPVGEDVPVGYYDRDAAAWVPSDNGRVIKITAINGGIATVDTVGTGSLPPIALTTAELQQLASLYAVGQELWRTPANHFSTWDMNWGIGPPDDADKPTDDPENNAPLDAPCEVSGNSTIECQNQILGETIGVVGTPFALQYQSDRVPGGKIGYHVDIPLSGATLPGPVKQIEMEIQIAGRFIRQSFPPTPNLQTTFVWDGNDVYGRRVQGTRPISVRTGYTYDGVYQRTSRFGGSGTSITGSRSRQQVTLWHSWSSEIGTWDARDSGLGGWMLSAHHAYDPFEQVLYRGDGGRQLAGPGFGPSINTFAGPGAVGAGNNTAICYNGEGIPALNSPVCPTGLAAGPDGSLYIAESDGHRVRKMAPDGLITTVAGTGVLCNAPTATCGDGGPATQAQLNVPEWIAVGPDGSLYISNNQARVRKVTPDGIITTVVGTGIGGFSGDGGPAQLAQINLPQGVAVAPDSSIYIADANNHRIRRVGPDAIISTVAGSNAGCLPTAACGDGGAATLAQLISPQGLAIGRDGSLYIADAGGNRIRQITPDGNIRTLAGTGVAGSGGDSGPANLAQLNRPFNITLGAEDSVYVSDSGNNRVRWISPEGIINTLVGTGDAGRTGDGGLALQARVQQLRGGIAVGPDGSIYIGQVAGNEADTRVRRIAQLSAHVGTTGTVIPSQDGSEVYIFELGGRHLQTKDAITGALRYQFAYDSAGRLSSVTDADANVTRIQRDGSGNPTGIVGPFGQSTALALNSNGFLSRITSPAGENVNITYTADGLLTSLANPRGHSSGYSFDSRGRLISVTDPTQAIKMLVRSGNNKKDYTVTMTTALGRATSYRVERLSNGDERRTTTDPAGQQIQTVRGLNGNQTVTYPDGTTVNAVFGPDPRWGMRAPLATRVTVTTPGGKVNNTTSQRTATLANPGDVVSLQTFTETVTINGRIFTSAYDAPSRTFTHTSPTGRQTHTILDNLGRPIQGEVVGLEPSSYTYDARGRLATTTQGAGAASRTTTLSYGGAGFLDSITDAIGRAVAYTTDADGRITEQALPDGRLTRFAYDANGNVTALTPPGRPDHTFTYTTRDQVSVYAAPLVGAENNQTGYSYDADRGPIQVDRPDGQSVGFRYDSAGRLDELLDLASDDRSYGYDAAGRLSTLSTPTIALAYAYDGGLSTGTTWSGAIAGRVDRAHDDNFRVTSQSVNGSNPIALQYDRDDLPTQVGDLTLTRDAQTGLITATTLGALSDSVSYDGFGAPVSYTASHSGNPVYSAGYIRDLLGRISQKTETLGSIPRLFDYTYDLAGRLSEVRQDGALVASYAYDTNGNRLSRTDAGGTLDATYDAQDRLIQYGSATYAHNPNGERQTKTTGAFITTYRYDGLGNLIGVTEPAGTQIEYLLDGAGRRIGKRINGTLVQGFLYQDGLRPIAELDGAGNVVSRFVYANRFNVPAYMVKSGVTYRIIADHLGSPRLVIEVATGQITQRMDHDEFGNVTLDTNPGFQPFGFAGGLYDRQTGLVHFGAREYDPETGRWTTKDPIGFGGGDGNVYAYVGNEPVNNVDPAGLCVCGLSWVVCSIEKEPPLSTEEKLSQAIGRLMSALARDPYNEELKRELFEADRKRFAYWRQQRLTALPHDDWDIKDFKLENWTEPDTFADPWARCAANPFCSGYVGESPYYQPPPAILSHPHVPHNPPPAHFTPEPSPVDFDPNMPAWGKRR